MKITIQITVDSERVKPEVIQELTHLDRRIERSNP